MALHVQGQTNRSSRLTSAVNRFPVVISTVNNQDVVVTAKKLREHACCNSHLKFLMRSPRLRLALRCQWVAAPLPHPVLYLQKAAAFPFVVNSSRHWTLPNVPSIPAVHSHLNAV
jgi:hypothetical protein